MTSLKDVCPILLVGKKRIGISVIYIYRERCIYFALFTMPGVLRPIVPATMMEKRMIPVAPQSVVTSNTCAATHVDRQGVYYLNKSRFVHRGVGSLHGQDLPADHCPAVDVCFDVVGLVLD